MTRYANKLGFRFNGAFTLVELLVVMAIIVIALGVMLPAFGRIIASQNFASAVNSVATTLGNARAQAIATQTPTGVAFLYDIETERFSLQLLDIESNQAFLTDNKTSCLEEPQCRAMRPMPFQTAVTLPARTGVFGLSFEHLRGRNSKGQPRENCKIDNKFGSGTNQWYAGEVINGNSADKRRHIIPWIFPRNDPRLFTRAVDPTDRNTIGQDPWARLIQGKGTVTDDQAKLALRHSNSFGVFFSVDGTVRPTAFVGGRQYADVYIEFPDEPRDIAKPDDPPYDDPIRFDPETIPTSVRQIDRRPNREVLLRAADMLAVADLSALESGVGRRRAWLSRTETSKAPPGWMTATGAGADLIDDDLVRDVSRWIDLNAEVISFNRYTGNVIRRAEQ